MAYRNGVLVPSGQQPNTARSPMLVSQGSYQNAVYAAVILDVASDFNANPLTDVFVATTVLRLAEEALSDAQLFHGGDEGFRHCLWICEMCRLYGFDFTSGFIDTFEAKTNNEAQDYANNHMALEHCCGAADCYACCNGLMDEGLLPAPIGYPMPPGPAGGGTGGGGGAGLGETVFEHVMTFPKLKKRAEREIAEALPKAEAAVKAAWNSPLNPLWWLK